MAALWQDIRYGLRMLARSPGFTAVALLTLALGIGANTAVFSVINAILLTPLPYQQPGQLVQIYQTMRNREEGVLDMSLPTYLDLRQRSRSFQDMAAFRRDTANLTGAGDPEQIACFAVSPHFWDVLGVSAAIGRSFTPEEAPPGRSGVVVLDHAFWQRRFGGDPAIVGKTIQLDRGLFTVTGILPKSFRFHAPPRYPRVDAFVPLVEQEAASAPRDSGGFNVIGRLKPGVALAQAREDLSRVAATMVRDYREYEGTKWVPRALDEVLFGEVRPALTVVLAGVGCVLLVACVNVAGLLMVWHLRRRSEISIRKALGAGHWRVARQFITECLLLTLAGAGLGLLLAEGIIRFMVSLIPSSTPVGGHIGVDARVLLFAAGTALVTGVLFGVLLSIPRADRALHQALAEAGTRLTGNRGAQRIQRGLVIAEIGAAFVLTICAMLLVQTFAGLLAVDPGFDPQDVLATSIQLPRAKANDAYPFFANLTERVGRLPGVQAAAVASSLPMRGPHSGTYFDIPGRSTPPGQRLIEYIQVVSPDYFRVVGTPLHAGRCFDGTERADTSGVVIVNRSFAHKYWPDEDPLGKHITAYNRDWQVVGIIGDIREFGLLGEVNPVQPLIYFTHAQYPRPDMQLVVRAVGSTAMVIEAVRREVFGLDPDQPVGDFAAMSQILAESVWSRRTMAILMSGFGILAFVLAVTGVYGLITYTVSQRTSEFGIRIALGAQRGEVFTSVLRDGLKTILPGMALGLVGAAMATHLIAGKLYGVSPLDPATFIGAVLIMAVVAILACCIPACKAARIDPMVALRCK
jgi:putative ABC transport system permease protein